MATLMILMIITMATLMILITVCVKVCWLSVPDR
jgi:hypothetical protein